MEGFKRTLKIIVASALALAVAVVCFLLFATYSQGVRAGVPVKFSRKGVIFKTYEGDLNVGGLTNSSEGAIPTTWEFSVARSDTDVHRDLTRAMQENRRVKLLYREKYVQLFFLGDTRYFVYEVEILE